MRKLSTAALAATVAVLSAVLSAPVSAATSGEEAAAGPVSAVWTPKELRFVYLGFTSKFSCDGLVDRMRSVLLLLGARKDLQVTPWGCSSPFGRPDPFPGVMIRMNVLEPAGNAQDGAKGGNAAATPVPAHWKMINVNTALAKDPLWQAGQCELLEQIKQSVLPKFSTRNVHYQSTCLPNQLSIGATQLRTEVLVPDEEGAAAPPGAPTSPATGPGPATPGAATAGAAALFVYPRNGQSAAQTQTDRDECHTWAASQSGYDPSRSTQPPSANAADYRRAMMACLDARGYTAR